MNMTMKQIKRRLTKNSVIFKENGETEKAEVCLQLLAFIEEKQF